MDWEKRRQSSNVEVRTPLDFILGQIRANKPLPGMSPVEKRARRTKKAGGDRKIQQIKRGFDPFAR